MIQIVALRSRLEKQPTDPATAGRNPRDLGDGALEYSWLSKISFEGDKFDGSVINFYPELNAFIGIHGSGKSTIREAGRFALDISFE